ncbi:MAG: putative alpha/beta-fold hydrolase [Planctomycetota bacterium]|jgi:predicted alpha/beta-fold hydrolase
MSSGSIKTSRFRPPWWLTNPHLQTLWPQLFRRPQTITLTPERLELPDGDFVDLCWTQKSNGPIVIVLHGLEGSIDSPYARGMMKTIHARGWRGVFMHFRGCSEEFNRLDRNYHSGDTGDIAYLINTLCERFPNTPIAAVAYSLGGNALLKYLGEYAELRRLSAAVAVSVPFLLGVGADRLAQGLSTIYQRHLIGRLQKKMKAKYRERVPGIRLDNINNLTTFRLFDDQITAPLHGFKDVDDYYNRSSSRQFLSHIDTPTLIIHSRDDPFMTSAAIPRQDELAQRVCLELSDKGGHVGFIGGKYPWQTWHWLEQRIPEFLFDYLEK